MMTEELFCDAPSPETPTELPLAAAGDVLRDATGSAVRAITDEAGVHAPAEQLTVFDSADQYLDELTQETKINRQLKMADILDHHRARIWSNMTIRICCSDGRIGQADFISPDLTATTLAHRYSPQAGALLVRGLSDVHDLVGLDAFYRANFELMHEVFNDAFRMAVEDELAWQNEFLEDMGRLVAANEFLIAQEVAAGRPSSAACLAAQKVVLEVTEQMQKVRAKEIRIVFESHSDCGSYRTHPSTPEERSACASHGCGAHKSHMYNAVEESLKQAYVQKLAAGETTFSVGGKPVLGRDLLAQKKLSFVTLHNFTREQELVLTRDITNDLLDPAGNVVALPEEFQELARTLVPADPAYVPPKRRSEDREKVLYPKNEEHHQEQRVVVSKLHLAQMMPHTQALELTPTPDLEHTAKILAVLLTIAAKNFGKSHPDKPLILHLDAPFFPTTKREMVWMDEDAAAAPELRTEVQTVREQYVRGKIRALDVVQHVPHVVRTSKRPVTDPVKLERIAKKNRREVEMRDALLWCFYEMTGRSELARTHVAEKLAEIQAALGAPGDASSDDLLPFIEAELRNPDVTNEQFSDLRHARLLVRFLRAIKRGTLLEGMGEADRELLASLDGRAQVALTKTNVWTYKTKDRAAA